MIKKGLLKRLKNIENSQKNLIRDDDNESIYYTPRLQFDSKDDEDEDDKITKQQYRHKTTNYLWLLKTFKSKGRRFDEGNKRCRRWHWREKSSFYW